MKRKPTAGNNADVLQRVSGQTNRGASADRYREDEEEKYIWLYSCSGEQLGSIYTICNGHVL